MAPEPDWTLGPAKWIAVGVLGAASVAGITWTIAQKYPAQPRERVIIQLPPEPAPAAAPPRVSAPTGREVLAIADEDPPPLPADDLMEELAANPGVIAVEAPTEMPPPVEPAVVYTRLIDVNTAPSAELQLLPGIGPALAGRIIEYRQANGPFRSVDELTNVRGIGPKTLEKLRERVRVE